MDWTKAKWRKSNFSSGGSCVEVAKHRRYDAEAVARWLSDRKAAA